MKANEATIEVSDQYVGQERPATAPFRVDTSRGTNKRTVSAQWASRPFDQRFVSLSSLREKCFTRYQEARTSIVETSGVRVHASRDDMDALTLELPDGQTTNPTHWAFGQVCSLTKAPAYYLRTLPGPIAAIPLQYGLSNHRSEKMKAYVTVNGDVQLRAMTGVDYGRIYDYEVVDAVAKIDGEGTGDTRWKIPGVMSWESMTHNPHVKPDHETTTLFASDRDVFMFLVDDANPIEVGKLDNGDPDLMFRGFYVWNSEVGSRSMGVATMYLRGVCCNRILWGVEGFEEIRLTHSKNAPDRFASEVTPSLNSFANASEAALIAGVKTAKKAIVAQNDDERKEWLMGKKFTAAEADSIVKAVLDEEGHPATSVWDFVQGITAVARTKANQDVRVQYERKAQVLLDKVA